MKHGQGLMRSQQKALRKCRNRNALAIERVNHVKNGGLLDQRSTGDTWAEENMEPRIMQQILADPEDFEMIPIP